MYASCLRQTYFDMPIHEFWCFGILTKLIFGFNVKNIDIYLFHVYWFISIYYMPKSCFNIMFLYLDEFWTKRIFNSKIQVLENTDFCFRQNF